MCHVLNQIWLDLSLLLAAYIFIIFLVLFVQSLSIMFLFKEVVDWKQVNI